MDRHPLPVVGAFIFNKDNQLLLAKSYKWRDFWIVPGGHIEWGESIEQAVRREVKEEVGLDVEDVELVATYEGIFPKEFHEKKHFIYLQCRCKTSNDQKVKKDNREIQEYQWFTLEEAKSLQNALGITKRTINLLAEKERNV